MLQQVEKKGTHISKEDLAQLTLKRKEKFAGDLIPELVRILKTQEEHLLKTVERFRSELDDSTKKLKQG